jgi:hypothetical protein
LPNLGDLFINMSGYGAIMNLNTKLIVVIVAAGIIAATITMLGTPKVLNLAMAQIRVTFLPQQQQPVQQQPNGAATTATTTSTSGNGPNCVGCITTQNLADGAVTNPKLGPLSVSSGNIGAGQVGTGNIADGAITNPKLAASSVSSTNIGAGQVTTGNIADNSVTAAKLGSDVPKRFDLIMWSNSGTSIPGDNGVFVICPADHPFPLGAGWASADSTHVTAADVEPVNANFGGSGTPAGWQVLFHNSGSADVAVKVLTTCANLVP